MKISIFKKNEKTITWGHFFAALSQLEGIPENVGPYACVMQAYQWDILAKSASVDALLDWIPNSQDEAIKGTYVGTVDRIDIYTTTNPAFAANGEMWQI